MGFKCFSMRILHAFVACLLLHAFMSEVFGLRQLDRDSVASAPTARQLCILKLCDWILQQFQRKTCQKAGLTLALHRYRPGQF